MAARPFPTLSPPLRDRLGPVEADLFEARVKRWWPDYAEAAGEVYPADELEDLDADVAEIVTRGFARRSTRLRRRDLERMVRPDWFADQGELGYSAYADRFGGDLAGVTERLHYLRELGVTLVHLLPLQTPRPDPNDGGQAVADHRSVSPALGTVEDLTGLTEALHHQGMSLGVDIVVSHVAREHEWARRARIGRDRYRRAFHVVGRRDDIDALVAGVPEAWPGTGMPFTWDDEVGGWVWTSFHPWQWDLDWSNSDVFCASLDIMCFLANAGVDMLRLVGLPFAWKREGTASRDLPEVHHLLQALRSALRIAAPSLVVAAPSPVTLPEHAGDPGVYSGRGTHAGREADLAARDDVAAHVLAALATREVGLATRALGRVAPHPPGTAWALAMRDHDEIDWRITDADAGAEGLDGPSHRAFLTDFYTGRFPGSFGRGEPFRVPVKREWVPGPAGTGERVAGSLASLLGLDAAHELDDGADRDAAVDAAVARILLVHAVALGHGGLPFVWSGDELALRNDVTWTSDPVREGDNRWLNRPALPWGRTPLGERAGDRHHPWTPAGRVFTGLAHLTRVRARLPQMHASVPAEVVAAPHRSVLAVLRRHPEAPLLGLYNVSERLVRLPATSLAVAGVALPATDALTGLTFRGASLWLAPYAVRWLLPADH